MSLVIEGDQPRHFPKNRDVFRFDEEVAEIFENMALRSIPMYAEIHRLHCRILASRFRAGCTVMDVGASTGRWFRTMRKELGVDRLDHVSGLYCVGVDNSLPMLDKLKAEFPEVDAQLKDISEGAEAVDAGGPFFLLEADVVVLFYVLQFIPDAKKKDALRWIYEHMADDGVLIMGQKETHFHLDEVFQEEYIKFRMDNGYTKEEIDAKTAALKNSMWCLNPRALEGLLQSVGFRHIVETTRWLHFSTWMVYK